MAKTHHKGKAKAHKHAHGHPAARHSRTSGGARRLSSGKKH